MVGETRVFLSDLENVHPAVERLVWIEFVPDNLVSCELKQIIGIDIFCQLPIDDRQLLPNEGEAVDSRPVSMDFGYADFLAKEGLEIDHRNPLAEILVAEVGLL